MADWFSTPAIPQQCPRAGGIQYARSKGVIMKKILAALLCSWCTSVSAQTAEELLNDGKNPDNVTTFGMGYDLKMYSPLKEINKSNVKRLVPIWSFSLMNDVGEHSQPTIYNGVMYVVNGNWTFAIDIATGRQIWRTPVQYERGALRVATSGALMRGPATIYQGKLFRQTVDAHVLALDMKTGKEIWKQKYAEWKEGYKGVIAPMIANGVLISGMGGGDSTTRGFVDGYDPDTGKRLWRRWTIPEPGEPGSETWPNQTKPDAWKYGGGATWQSASYDPQLDLLYIGTGNAEPYNPTFRDGQDCLYTASILALRPKTGEMVWYYQTVPNDSFDFDATAESLLADLKVDGKDRKVLINAHKNGFLYVIDRTNGKPIAANPYVKVNWAKSIDLKTGRPVLTDLLERAMKGETVNVFPSRGTNATLIAFNPKTNLVYVNSWNFPRLMKYVDFKFVLGTGSTGIESTMATPPGEPAGYHMAIEPLTGKVVWQQPMTDFASSAGMLATDGGLLFTGLLTGEFIALDQDNGKRLWQFKTGSSVNAPPITYTYKGRQYVTVLSGRGGSVAGRLINDLVPAGGSVWTFALTQD
jgi:alcohol dehydrogenase (cytochrome c)